jgi:hypothetical protein
MSMTAPECEQGIAADGRSAVSPMVCDGGEVPDTRQGRYHLELKTIPSSQVASMAVLTISRATILSQLNHWSLTIYRWPKVDMTLCATSGRLGSGSRGSLDDDKLGTKTKLADEMEE